MQELIVIVLFLGALFYIGKLLYSSFFQKNTGSACAKGCGSCSAIDVAKIEAEIKQKL